MDNLELAYKNLISKIQEGIRENTYTNIIHKNRQLQNRKWVTEELRNLIKERDHYHKK